MVKKIIGIVIILFIIILLYTSPFSLKERKNSYHYFKEINQENIQSVHIEFPTINQLKISNFKKGSLKPYLIIDESIVNNISISNIKVNGYSMNGSQENIKCMNNKTYCLVYINGNIILEYNTIILGQDIFKIKGRSSFIGLTYSNE